jgi:hypothetical protein
MRRLTATILLMLENCHKLEFQHNSDSSDGKIFWRVRKVSRSAITHASLMRESTKRIEGALRSEDSKEHLIAQRILESTAAFRSWELEHSGLMRTVADSGALRRQAGMLRQTALRLIHAKALFEYLRRRNLRESDRKRVVTHFYPTRLFQEALVQEYGSYLRKAGSFLCTSHLGTDYLIDPAFLDPMQHYEKLYAQYFELYCSTLLPVDLEATSQSALLPLLKHQLTEWRWIILNPRAATPRLARESEIRRPLGDTQRMNTLTLVKD